MHGIGLFAHFPIYTGNLSAMNHMRLNDGTGIAVYGVAGRHPRRREVGTMGFILLAIAYIVLGIVASARLITGHA